MTPTLLAALAALASAEADAAFDRCDAATGWYCHRLYKRIVAEVGEADPLVWHRASEYLAGRDLPTTGNVPPSPASSWATLGL